MARREKKRKESKCIMKCTNQTLYPDRANDSGLNRNHYMTKALSGAFSRAQDWNPSFTTLEQVKGHLRTNDDHTKRTSSRVGNAKMDTGTNLRV